jgi:small subunit ribosomal protein S8
MDFIGDFLTVIRNASSTGKEKVLVPTSKQTSRIAEILKEEGFIDNFKLVEEGPKRYLRLHLKYYGKEPAIHAINRISKPGFRRYVGREDVPKVLGGLGIAIVSTSSGIITDKQARQKKIGGELICKVW